MPALKNAGTKTKIHETALAKRRSEGMFKIAIVNF